MNAVTFTPEERGRFAGGGLVILAVYLALSAVPAIIATVSGRTSVFIAIVHLAALAGVAMLITRRASGVAVEWIPLVAIPLLYTELPHIAVPRLYDATVQHWESLFFGASPARTAATNWPYPALSELLHAGYISYYAIIFGPPLFLYLRGQSELFRGTVAGLMTTFAVCYAVFIVFPVAGPRYQWTAPAGSFDGPVRQLVLGVLSAGSAKGTAFPSSHVAVATVQSLLAFRWSVRAGVGLSVLTTLLAFGAVYGGFHYAVDVMAGAGVGLALGLALSFATRDLFAGLVPKFGSSIKGVDQSAGDVR
jgi:membrane-associated phospholipid phosphatase